MPASTLYVVQPFGRGDDGDLVAGEPQQAQSAEQAKRMAKRISDEHAGVIAFSRTGDTLSRTGDASIGEYEPAVILLTLARCRTR